QRIGSGNASLIGEQEEIAAAGNLLHGVDHVLDALLGSRHRQYPQRIHAVVLPALPCPAAFSVEGDIAGEAGLLVMRIFARDRRAAAIELQQKVTRGLIREANAKGRSAMTVETPVQLPQLPALRLGSGLGWLWQAC